MWHILVKTPGGVRLGDQILPQQPTLSEMSHSDLNFALTVQSLLNRIQHPEYRQIVVEVNIHLFIPQCLNLIFSISFLIHRISPFLYYEYDSTS